MVVSFVLVLLCFPPPEFAQRAVKPILMGKDCIAQAQSGERPKTHVHTHTHTCLSCLMVSPLFIQV